MRAASHLQVEAYLAGGMGERRYGYYQAQAYFQQTAIVYQVCP